MTDLNLKLILQALDKGATTTVRRLTATVHGLSGETKAAPRGWRETSAAITQTTRAAERFNNAGRGSLSVLDRLGDSQRRLRRESALDRLAADSARRSGGGARTGGLGGLGMLASGAAGGLVGAGVGIVGGFLINGGIQGGRRIFDESIRRDSLISKLAGAGQSRSAASGSLGWIDKFATKNNQSLEDVTEAYIRLKNKGVDPTAGSLTTLGNAAYANSKTLGNAVEMFLDAQRGQFGALNGYAIEARKVGRQVVFSWEQDGKRMTATSSRTAAGVRQTLSEILENRHKGAMEKGNQGLGEMLRRLGASRDSFLGRIGDKGFTDKLKGQVGRFLDFLDKAEKDGRLDRWATKISGSFESVLSSMEKVGKAVDWEGLINDTAKLAGVVGQLADRFETLEHWSRLPGLNLSKYLTPWGVQSAGGDLARTIIGGKPRPTLSDGRRGQNAEASMWSSGPGRRLTGYLGGPMQPVTVEGRLKVDLAPGMRIVRNDFGLDERRGLVGSRP